MKMLMLQLSRRIGLMGLVMLSVCQFGPAPAASASPAQSAVIQESRASATGVAIIAYPRRGEGLSQMAQRLCGDGRRWRQIYTDNRELIGSNPNLIHMWQAIRVRCAGQAASTPTSTPPRSMNRWVHPLPGAVLTSCWGAGRDHRGIDLARASGTPVRAIGSGVVTQAGWIWGGYGISVVIKHGDGIWSHYAHLSRAGARVGQRVDVGEVIGRVGSTGDSTGPHLHLELARTGAIIGSQINPAPWLRAHGVRIGC